MYELRKIDKWGISQSQLNLFATCKAYYFFRYLTNLGDLGIVWPGNLFGKTLHAILEDILKMISEGRRDEADILRSIKGMFPDKFSELRTAAGKRWRASREYNEEKFNIEGEKYARVLASFINKFLPQTFHELKSEMKVEIPFDEKVVITGIIDVALFHTPEQYEIFDLKITTDSSKFYFVDWEYETQSLLYELLTHKTYNNKMDAFTFVVINRHEKALFLKQRYLSMDVDNVNEDTKYQELYASVKELRDFIYNIPSDIKKLKCNKYDTCRWCEYKKFCDKL